MINQEQLLTGILMGTILIVIGLVPGLLDKWAEKLADFAETLFYGSAIGSRERVAFGEQRWLAALGMTLIALSLYLFTAR